MPIPSDLTIDPVQNRTDLDAWLSVPRRINTGNPYWVEPLKMVERHRVTPEKNPFFKYADVALFLARRGGEPVGRISAQVSRPTLGDATGHFGFLETINDQAVANALLDAATRYVAERGMQRIAGPYNLSTNEECGILVEGFDSLSTAFMPQSARWQGALVEGAGFSGEMDLYAYRLSPTAHPDIAEWFTAFSDPAVTTRNFIRAKLDDELATAVGLFNDAWSENWGFVPFTNEHMKFLFDDFRMFFRSHYGQFLYVDGELAGFAIMIPNLTELIAGFDGHLLPLNWLKLIYRLGTERYKTVRVPLFGIAQKYQRTPRAAAIFATFIRKAIEDVGHYGFDWMELSWILQSNKALTTFIERKAGLPSKTYRLYARTIKST